MAEKWDGKGKPPSRKAAIEWVAKETGVTVAQATDAMPKSGTLTFAGDKARQIVVVTKGAADKGGGGFADGITSAIDRAMDKGVNVRGLPSPFGTDLPGLDRNGGGGGKPTPGRQNDPAGTADLDGDGTITADEQTVADAAGGDNIDLGDMPTGAGDTRGAPLWPYQGSPEQLAGLQVKEGGKDATVKASMAARYSKMTDAQLTAMGLDPEAVRGYHGKIGARYYEQDTLEPLKWSAEQRADLQRVMYSVGVYGNAKVKLGSWSAKDQAVYAELLSAANVEGLTWHEMLARWKAHPPEDLLEQINSEGPKRPAISVTNALDIQQTAQGVSQSLTGEVDPGFSASTVSPYQGMEAAYQNSAYDMGQAGTGGTVQQAPSVGAYVEDRLRRENPIEVDGYQFLTQFQSLLGMLGAS